MSLADNKDNKIQDKLIGEIIDFLMCMNTRELTVNGYKFKIYVGSDSRYHMCIKHESIDIDVEIDNNIFELYRNEINMLELLFAKYSVVVNTRDSTSLANIIKQILNTYLNDFGVMNGIRYYRYKYDCNMFIVVRLGLDNATYVTFGYEESGREFICGGVKVINSIVAAYCHNTMRKQFFYCLGKLVNEEKGFCYNTLLRSIYSLCALGGEITSVYGIHYELSSGSDSINVGDPYKRVGFGNAEIEYESDCDNILQSASLLEYEECLDISYNLLRDIILLYGEKSRFGVFSHSSALWFCNDYCKLYLDDYNGVIVVTYFKNYVCSSGIIINWDDGYKVYKNSKFGESYLNEALCKLYSGSYEIGKDDNCVFDDIIRFLNKNNGEWTDSSGNRYLLADTKDNSKVILILTSVKTNIIRDRDDFEDTDSYDEFMNNIMKVVYNTK